MAAEANARLKGPSVCDTVDDKKLWKHHTLDVVLRRITWSLNLIFTEQMPSGESICRDGTCFAVTEIRGYQLFHKEISDSRPPGHGSRRRCATNAMQDPRPQGPCVGTSMDGWHWGNPKGPSTK